MRNELILIAFIVSAVANGLVMFLNYYFQGMELFTSFFWILYSCGTVATFFTLMWGRWEI